MRIRKLAVFFLYFLSLPAFAQVFEAEEAILSNGAEIVEDPEVSGGAYVAQKDGDLLFNINIGEEEYYDIYINASSPNGDKVNHLSVNGSTLTFGLGKNNQFQKIRLVIRHKIPKGDHKIEIIKSWGWINIDYIEILKVSTGPVFNIKQQLANSEASDEANSLYHFLLDTYGRNIISGVMTLNSMDEAIWLKENTGKEPALLGIDFMHSGRGYDWYNDSIPVKDAFAWYNRNGIPAMMWHWRDPSKQTEEFYSSMTSFDVSKVLDQNSAEYDSIVADIDHIAGYLKFLQEKGVPVIWRPLHEAAGGWFWWGAKGPEPLKILYKLLYERLVNHHQLNNLIWVWTREPFDDEWYPGDDVVDIVGRDIYKTGDHTAQEIEYSHANAVYEGKMMLALSETGSFPDPDSLVSQEAGWLWFMPWYGKFTRNEYYNSMDLWQKTLTHDYVVTLDEMPSLKDYERQFEPGPITAIEDQHEIFPSVRAYPTVTDYYVTVESNFIIRSLVIYDGNGRILKELEPNKHYIEVSLAEMNSGMYFIRVNYEKTLRIIKR
ncbi:MAG: glycosyl hydrolase [Candidatus Cyclobacteriaceae bacterium M2_1C_046]